MYLLPGAAIAGEALLSCRLRFDLKKNCSNGSGTSAECLKIPKPIFFIHARPGVAVGEQVGMQVELHAHPGMTAQIMEIERVLRLLPSSITGDSNDVRNGERNIPFFARVHLSSCRLLTRPGIFTAAFEMAGHDAHHPRRVHGRR